MKKNLFCYWKFKEHSNLLKVFRIMKLSLFMMLLGILNVYSGNVISQEKKISINQKNISVKDVLKELESKTPYTFLYNDELIDVNRRVDVKANDESLISVLDKLFYGSSTIYKIIEKRIILIPSKESMRNIQQQTTYTVTGKVIEKNGDPLPGVNVYDKSDPSHGVITSVDGTYSITVSNSDAILAFSFVGFETQEVNVASRKVIEITLMENSISLNEVVAIGYGSQKKSDITGSVAVVDMDALPVKSPVSIAQSLQGAAPGVQVINSGDPGAGPIIRIRGLSSFGNNEPLYVIDGVPSVANRDFNPHDVESIQILKDASAASIYGSRAANGVVLITTKKGKGDFSINFDGRYGVEQVPKKIDMMSSLQYAELDNIAHDNAGLPHSTASEMVVTDPSSMPNTDWQGYMFQPGVIQDYNLDVNAKSGNSTYRIGLGYFDREGVIRGPEFSRTSFSLSTTHDYKKLQLGSSVRLTYTEASDVIGAPFFEALTALPNVAIYNKNNVGGYGAGDDVNQTYFTNPVGNQLSRDFRAHGYKAVVNLFAEYNFTDAFKYRFTTSVDASNQRWVGKREAAYLRYKDNPISSLDERTTHWLDWTFNHMFTYDKMFGKHNVTAVAVYSYEGHKDRYSRAYGENVSQDGDGNYFWVLDATKENQTINGAAGETGLHSFITRVNYGFANKYLLQVSGRYDYSSQFVKESRGAFFPAGSLGWKISEESFLSDSENIDLIKLRVGYGELGGKNIGFYDYAGFINTNVNYVFGTDQHLANGATQIKLANPDLIWETTASANIGVDFGFYRNRLQGSFEVYQTDTRNAILPVDLAISTGNFGGNPNQNIGDIRNSGIELTLTYQRMESDFKYRVTFNGSSNKNEVRSLGSLGQLSGNLTMSRPGYPIGKFFLRETDGIFQIGEEEEASKQGAFPGDVHFVDQDDNNIIDDNDRVMMGNPFPLADMGLNLYFEYKGFDASIFLFSQLGHDIFWGQGYVTERTDDYMNHPADFEPWTPENMSNTTPIAMYGAAGGRNYYGAQDRYLYDGDYLKLKNLEIGYTIPEHLMEKIGFKKLRVYFSGQNLFTITSYPGYDPEVINGWILERGVDWGAYPNPRTVSFGIQAKF
jgi:TonB-linked SusC/RagA family outer membrane protein